MNEKVNKVLLAGDIFIPAFTYSSCEPSTKNKERIQKFNETGDSQCIYQNELDKACFQYGMACGDFKGSTRRTVSKKY